MMREDWLMAGGCRATKCALRRRSSIDSADAGSNFCRSLPNPSRLVGSDERTALLSRRKRSLRFLSLQCKESQRDYPARTLSTIFHLTQSVRWLAVKNWHYSSRIIIPKHHSQSSRLVEDYFSHPPSCLCLRFTLPNWAGGGVAVAVD